jgi:hypothetical protein
VHTEGGCLVGLLLSCLVGWLVNCLVVWLVSLFYWLVVGYLITWFAG